MITFIINLNDSKDRLVKFKNINFTRWSGTSRIEVSDEINKKMISYYNLPRPAHLGRCGCFISHMRLYQHIVENKLNDVLILEDDAVKVADIPTEYPNDAITYLGGFIKNKQITSKKDIFFNTENGIHPVDKTKLRVLMTMSYIVPTWQVARDILQEINSLQRYRAIDILLGNININTYYSYPASYIESSEESTICKKSKKSNEFYKWVSK